MTTENNMKTYLKLALKEEDASMCKAIIWSAYENYLVNENKKDCRTNFHKFASSNQIKTVFDYCTNNMARIVLKWLSEDYAKSESKAISMLNDLIYSYLCSK